MTWQVAVRAVSAVRSADELEAVDDVNKLDTTNMQQVRAGLSHH